MRDDKSFFERHGLKEVLTDTELKELDEELMNGPISSKGKRPKAYTPPKDQPITNMDDVPEEKWGSVLKYGLQKSGGT